MAETCPECGAVMDAAYCTACGTRLGDPWEPPEPPLLGRIRREIRFELRDLGRAVELLLPGVEPTWSCSRCGAAVATDQAYCGVCGQDVSERRYTDHARTESHADAAGVLLVFLLAYMVFFFGAASWAGPRGGLDEHFALVMGGPIVAAAIVTAILSRVLH